MNSARTQLIAYSRYWSSYWRWLYFNVALLRSFCSSQFLCSGIGQSCWPQVGSSKQFSPLIIFITWELLILVWFVFDFFGLCHYVFKTSSSKEFPSNVHCRAHNTNLMHTGVHVHAIVMPMVKDTENLKIVSRSWTWDVTFEKTGA